MPRAGLTPQRVTEEAARIVDAEGLEVLSLARLASRLGVAPPSLYKHVHGLDDLTDRVAALATGMLAEVLTDSVMGREGRSALTSLGQAYRGFAHDHPGLYPLTQQHLSRMGEDGTRQAQRAVDAVAAALRAYRIPEGQMVNAVRMARSCLHGFVDLERSGGFARPEPVETSFAVLLDMLDVSLCRMGEG